MAVTEKACGLESTPTKGSGVFETGPGAQTCCPWEFSAGCPRWRHLLQCVFCQEAGGICYNVSSAGMFKDLSQT